MKPNFALKLSNDGVELLHRASAGWSPVGSVSFADDDVAVASAALVAKALTLQPDGVATKLIIPASELRYASVVAPGPTDEARRYQIEAEVERMTPYPLDELVYDFTVEGDTALVVVCARETLAEAETFADGYGFNPVCFVAQPEPGAFTGEPWFGETLSARANLPAGVRVARDVEPVRVHTARVPAAGVIKPATPPVTTVPPRVPLRGRGSVIPAPETSTAPVTPATPRPATLPTPSAEPRAKVGDLVRRMGTRLRREQAALPKTETPPVVVTPAKVDVPVKATDDAVSDAPVAFASRRPAISVVSARETSAPAAPPPPGPGGRIAVLPPSPPAKSSAARPLEQVRSLGVRAGAGVTAVVGRMSSLRLPSVPRVIKARAAAVPAPLVPASRPPVNEQDRSREKEAMTVFGARGNSAPQPSMARRGLMVAGGVMALLIAVAVWTLYLNAGSGTQVASVTEGGSEPLAPIAAPSETAITAPVQPATAAAVPEAVPTPVETVVAAPVTDPEELLESLVAQARDEALPVETVETAARVAEAVTEATTPTPASDPAVALREGPQPAAPSPANTGPVQVAGTEAETARVAASSVPDIRLSLPRGFDVPRADEVVFVAPASPPPFGREFNFDATGLIEATPEGAQTPAGVTVFARRPALVPAPAPGRPDVTLEAPAAPAPGPVAAAIESALAEAVATPEPAVPVVADDTPRADPALANARPLPRPERVREIGEQLAPPAPAAPAVDDQTLLDVPGGGVAAPEALTETAALETPPPGGVSLAALRPQRRPTDLAPEETAAAVAPVPEVSLDLTGATAEAVAQSPVPGERPSDVEARAAQILAAAAVAPARAAPSEAIEDDEGETASSTAAPDIPSSASVARQATETDAINLGEVNLIGVFGTPGDRRALVRLSGGRVVRVSVGDRLDGGTISAIGETELRYSSGGSNRVLRIGG